MKSFKELVSLQGSQALVIGGSGYLGEQITSVLHELGAHVHVTSRDALSRIRSSAELSPLLPSSRLTVFNSDFTTDTGRQIIQQHISQISSGLNILVNCAWNGTKSSLDLITPQQWDHDIDVCLSSVFKTTQLLIPFLRPTSSIINIASMYGHVSPNPYLYQNNLYTNPPSYGAAKAGIIQLTKYLAVFLADQNIRVNAISPGPFPFPDVSANEDFNHRLSNLNPLRRIGAPHEIKGAVALLSTDLSSYITGQNICVDGGWSIW